MIGASPWGKPPITSDKQHKPSENLNIYRKTCLSSDVEIRTWHQEEYEVSPMTEKSTNKRNVPAKPMASDISLNSQSKCKISIWNSLG
ncbi:hypothetical protein Leryth_004572 [Lithospermum erythrorhizon]|nr:hypothetical protein Leryth_004572 [Lithospermum erythrorhizon]